MRPTSVVRLHLQWLSLNLVSIPLGGVPLLPPAGGTARDTNSVLIPKGKEKYV